MIRVLVYLGEGDERQLAELKISWMNHLPLGWARYNAEIAVDCGEDIKLMTRSFDHHREKKNVLSLIESAILQLEEADLELTGKMDAHPQRMGAFKELTSFFRSMAEWHTE